MNYMKWNNKNMIVYYNDSKIFSIIRNFSLKLFLLNRLQFTESCGIALLDYQTKKESLEQRAARVCSEIYFFFIYLRYRRHERH